MSRSVVLLSQQLPPLVHCMVCADVVGTVCGSGGFCCVRGCGCRVRGGACCAWAGQANNSAAARATITESCCRFMSNLLVGGELRRSNTYATPSACIHDWKRAFRVCSHSKGSAWIAQKAARTEMPSPMQKLPECERACVCTQKSVGSPPSCRRAANNLPRESGSALHDSFHRPERLSRQRKFFASTRFRATRSPGGSCIQRFGSGAARVDLRFQQALDAGINAPGRPLAVGIRQFAANHAHRSGALSRLAREGFPLRRPPCDQRGGLVVAAFLIHHGEHVQKICPIHGYLLFIFALLLSARS